MRHVNYKRWAAYVIDLFQFAEGKRVERVLELACGTGKVLVELAKAGYQVCGMDLSHEMLRQAAERWREERRAHDSMQNRPSPLAVRSSLFVPRLWCGNMQNFAVASPVDAAICLYDSFNYCLEPESARRLLNDVAAAVRRGGLFIFDICTEHNCRRNFGNYYEHESYLEISYIRRSHFKPYRKTQVNEFFISDDFSCGPTLCERHEQRIYSVREINDMIDPQQWQVVGDFDGMSRRPGSEKSDRVHFVLRRI